MVTAQQVRSYKPDPAHFKEAERRIGTKKGWVHVASSYYYDVEPCIKAKIPVIWVNRHKEQLDASQKKPTAEVKSLLEAAKLLGAGLRAVGLHADVIAVTSRAYATGCVLVRSGEEAFCIDSPVFPDELEILPAMAAAGGLPRGRAAGHARRLGPPARRATPSPRRRSAWRRPRPRG